MDIHEYQGKQLLAKFGVNIPPGEVVYQTHEAENIVSWLNEDKIIVKAQVHAGGRGKAGGVKICNTNDEVIKTVDKMIGMNDYMNGLLLKQKVMGDSDKLKEIIGWIKDNKSMTKQEIMTKLDWGRGIKWTPYRRALMNHPNIYDVNDSEPTYNWKEQISLDKNN